MNDDCDFSFNVLRFAYSTAPTLLGPQSKETNAVFACEREDSKNIQAFLLCVLLSSECDDDDNDSDFVLLLLLCLFGFLNRCVFVAACELRIY